MQKTPVCSLGWEDPLEGRVPYSGILAWRIPTEEPGRLTQSPWSCKFVGHNWAAKYIIQCTYVHTHIFTFNLQRFLSFPWCQSVQVFEHFSGLLWKTSVLYMRQVFFFFCSGITIFDLWDQGNCYLHIWLLQRNWCPSWKTKIRNVHNMEQNLWLNTWL